ncbi:MAG: phosphoribosylglycinamide formyltransferase [Thermoplasmatota archaeon]
MYRIAVLASGRGTNFRAIAEAVERKEIPAEIAILIVNKRDAGALDYAQGHGIRAAVIESDSISRDAHERDVLAALDAARVDLVVLAGYMRLLSPAFVKRYEWRIVNIHPALLPAFPGLHAQRQALAAGVRVTGATTHFVTADMDAGPIILQAAVPIAPDDTEDALSERILKVAEHALYPVTIKLLAEGRVHVRDGRVTIDGARRADGNIVSPGV